MREIADSWQAERDELQARLDVSMPLPLDADGVPSRIGDHIEVDGLSGTITEVSVNLTESGPSGTVVIRMDHLSFEPFCEVYEPHECHHSPKPETIEDIRGGAHKSACYYFGARQCIECPANDQES